MMKQLILLVIMIGINVCVNAQGINLYHKIEDSKLWLRWELSDPSVWYQSNESGYKILVKDQNEKVILDSTIINTTQVYESREDGTIEKLLFYLSDRNRLSGEILSEFSEQDLPEVSLDTITEEIFYELSSRKYEYLEKAGLATNLEVDLGLGYSVELSTQLSDGRNYSISETIEPSEYQKPEIPTISAEWKDKQVIINWNTFQVKDQFLFYNLSQSLNGENFVTTDSLLLNYYDGDDVQLYNFDVPVKLNYNDTTYWIRLTAIDYFGHVSENFSEVSGSTYQKIGVSPFFTEVKQLRTNEAHMKWSIPEKFKDDVQEYRIYVAENYDGPYFPDSMGISPTTFETKREIPFRSAYFRIIAVDRVGAEYSSFPKLIVSVDTLAPAIPKDLTYTIDTNGILDIKWNLNDEEDFIGYKLFYCHDTTVDMTLAHGSYLTEPTFRDTIELRTTNREIYFKAISVDSRNNRSDFSEMLIVEKPDILPPVQPQFIKSIAGPGSITLQWYQSISEDVVEQRLFRKQLGDGAAWKLLEIWNNNVDTTYIDEPLEEFVKYLYTLTVRDEAGNESEPTKPMMNFALPDLRGFDIDQWSLREGENVSTKISHSFSVSTLDNVMIYRKEEGGELYLLAELRNGELEFVDHKIQKGKDYSYAVKVLFQNGIESPLSDYKSIRL